VNHVARITQREGVVLGVLTRTLAAVATYYCSDFVIAGTGKTLTGVKLVYWYVDMNKQHRQKGGSHRQVLYCGPSNSSVDVAASKICSHLLANTDALLIVKDIPS